MIYGLASNKFSSILITPWTVSISNHWWMITKISLFPTLELGEILIKNTVSSTIIVPKKEPFFKEAVTIFFLFLHKNICCGYSLEVPQWGTSNEPHNICFSGEIRNIFTQYPLLSRAMLYAVITTFNREYLIQKSGLSYLPLAITVLKFAYAKSFFYYLFMCLKILLKRVGPHQMPDLGLHCLLMPLCPKTISKQVSSIGLYCPLMPVCPNTISKIASFFYWS